MRLDEGTPSVLVARDRPLLLPIHFPMLFVLAYACLSRGSPAAIYVLSAWRFDIFGSHAKIIPYFFTLSVF